MADYSSVLSRAVASKKTYEERRVVYERARNALVNQLRSINPPLPEADITRQRLALEESIRKVEADLSGNAPAAIEPPQVAVREEPPVAPPQPAPPPIPPAPPKVPAPAATVPPPPLAATVRPPPPAATAPSPPPAVTVPLPPPQAATLPPPPAAAAHPPKPAPNELPPRTAPRVEPSMPALPASAERRPDPPLRSPLSETVREAQALGQATTAAARSARDALQDARPVPGATRVEPRLEAMERGPGDPTLVRVRSLPATEPEPVIPNRKPLVFGLIAAIVVLAVAAAGFLLFRPAEDSNGQRLAQGQTSQPPKIPDRVAQDPNAPARPGPGGSTTATPASAPHNAFLYEENADNPRGADNFRGTVAWRIDTEAGSGGPERIIRGLVDLPDRGLKMLMTIRRNQDQALPASHTVELLFETAPNFVHGGVENVAGLRMKPSEQANGLPLVGAAARITPGYFLIGLSALGPDRERNVVLLRDRPWMDLPLLYRNGRRAVLAIEKGPTGERIFQEAFQAWGS